MSNFSGRITSAISTISENKRISRDREREYECIYDFANVMEDLEWRLGIYKEEWKREKKRGKL